MEWCGHLLCIRALLTTRANNDAGLTGAHLPLQTSGFAHADVEADKKNNSSPAVGGGRTEESDGPMAGRV